MKQVTKDRPVESIRRPRMAAGMFNKPTLRNLKGRILVVDDEPQVAAVLQDLLTLAGFDVETAENGRQALNLLTTARRFDLMITDMKMPEMDGLELLKMAQGLKKPPPVVVLTGYATVDNGIRSLEEGAHDYLLKPFNTETLMLAVQRALESHAQGWA